jgi:hypothetical protein
LSYEVDLLFKRQGGGGRGGHDSGDNDDEGPYQLITITPALISAEKLLSILLEAQEMVQSWKSTMKVMGGQ